MRIFLALVLAASLFVAAGCSCTDECSPCAPAPKPAPVCNPCAGL